MTTPADPVDRIPSPVPSAPAAGPGATPRRRARAAVVGHVCIDENTVDGRTTTSWGSPAVYMYRPLLLDHDVDVSIVSPYGDDFAPFAEGLPLVNAPTSDRTMLYRNVVVDGVRTQQCLGVEESAPVPVDARIDRMLGRADLLLLCPLAPTFSPAAVSDLVDRLPAGAVRILLAQGYLRDVGPDGVVRPRVFSEAVEILPLFDLVVLSDEDMPEAFAAASRWVAAVPGIRVVITQNSAGASLVTAGADGTAVVRSFAAEGIDASLAADSIGAGDVFSAELAHAFWRSRDAASAIVSANRAAARFLADGSRAGSAGAEPATSSAAPAARRSLD